MFKQIIIVTSITYLTIGIFIHPGCTLPDGPDKQYEHNLTEIYYFDIDSDSLHILFGHNSGYPPEDTKVEISNYNQIDRIRISLEISGKSGDKTPYIYRYIKFIDEYSLQFFISGRWFDYPDKQLYTDYGIAAIKTRPAPPHYYFTHISIHKPQTVQVSYNFVILPP